MWKVFVFACIIGALGCTAERAYFVAPYVPVRLGENIKNTKVWVKETSTGEMIEAKADLYKGMWIVVDPKEWDAQSRASNMNLVKDE